jgi:hypothetical protein
MIWALLAILAGSVAIAVQAPINARLATPACDGMAAGEATPRGLAAVARAAGVVPSRL